MFVCLIKNQVRPEGVDAYIKAARKFACAQEQKEGCCRAFVIQNASCPAEVVNVEYWESALAKAQDDGSAFAQYKPQLKPYFLTNTTETYETV